MPNPVSRAPSSVRPTRTLAGLMSLWTRPLLVHLQDSRGDADGELQEALDRDGRADQLAEQLAFGVLEHQGGSARLLHQFQRPERPRAVEVVLQRVFVCETHDAAWCRFRCNHGHAPVPGTTRATAPRPANPALAVFPQHLGAGLFTAIVELSPVHGRPRGRSREHLFWCTPAEESASAKRVRTSARKAEEACDPGGPIRL